MSPQTLPVAPAPPSPAVPAQARWTFPCWLTLRGGPRAVGSSAYPGHCRPRKRLPALSTSAATAVPTPGPRLTEVQAVEGKPGPRVEGPSRGRGEALHLGAGLHRLLDGGVLAIKPVPAPHAAVQTGVYLGRQRNPSGFWGPHGHVMGSHTARREAPWLLPRWSEEGTCGSGGGNLLGKGHVVEAVSRKGSSGTERVLAGSPVATLGLPTHVQSRKWTVHQKDMDKGAHGAWYPPKWESGGGWRTPAPCSALQQTRSPLPGLTKWGGVNSPCGTHGSDASGHLQDTVLHPCREDRANTSHRDLHMPGTPFSHLCGSRHRWGSAWPSHAG